MDGSEQLAADAEEEDFVRLCARDLDKKAFFEEVDANPRESLVALLIRAYLDILLDILRRPVLMQKAVPVLQDMDMLDVLQPYIASKWVHNAHRRSSYIKSNTCLKPLSMSMKRVSSRGARREETWVKRRGERS